jgi:repressor of nif and glnA expression
MIGQESKVVEREKMAILKVLSDSPMPLGGRIIARRLSDLGYELGERAVRYHLQLMDQRGLTQIIGRKDGRSITSAGLDELRSALVSDRLGYVAARIELLAYATTFDPERRDGQLPIDISLLPRNKLPRALELMQEAFNSGLCVSDLVAMAGEGDRLGEVIVPQGKVGLATVSSVAVCGALLKAGIPIISRFEGILQLRGHHAIRFTELVDYSGCSFSSAEVFIASKMTAVRKACAGGDGKILASFLEFSSPCKQGAGTILERLRSVGFDGVVKMGEVNEPLCEVSTGVNRVGLIVKHGLNPAAVAAEAGIEVANRAMSGVIEHRDLKSIGRLLE